MEVKKHNAVWFDWWNNILPALDYHIGCFMGGVEGSSAVRVEDVDVDVVGNIACHVRRERKTHVVYQCGGDAIRCE